MTDMIEPEGRVYPRKKPFHCKAKVAIGEKAPLDASGVDVSMGGVCLLTSEHVEFGQFCVVKFEVAIDGVTRQFSSVSKSIYCAAAGTDGFRVGFQFSGLDQANTALLNEIMSQP
ncbi:MAG: PilZ domain-containing protein [Methylomonas sp.]